MDIRNAPKAYTIPCTIKIDALRKLTSTDRIEDFLKSGGSLSIATGAGNIHGVNQQIMNLVMHIEKEVEMRYHSKVPVALLDEDMFLTLSDGRDVSFLSPDKDAQEVLNTKLLFIRSLGAIRYATEGQKDRFKKHFLRLMLRRRENLRCTFLSWLYPLDSIFDRKFLTDVKSLIDTHKVV